MAQSLAKIYVHLVFSTKLRQPLIAEPILPELHAYLAGILNTQNCPTLQVGGMADHVHILFQLARTKSLSEVVEEVKKSSSKWMKTKGAEHFSWQNGYGAFSVSESNMKDVVRYIQNQEAHHRTIDFQDELRTLLDEFGIAYDEKYLWD